MIRIGIVGDIGSGKSHIAKNFNYPVFNADHEVGKLYKYDRKIFLKLKKILPKYFQRFPIEKDQVTKAIISDSTNLKKIIKIVHLEIKKKLRDFLNKNKSKKIVILDIPLLLENKLNKRKDILIFVQSKKAEIKRRLKERPNYNSKIFEKFKKIQLPLDYKKKKSDFIIKNNFNNKSIKRDILKILRVILK